MPTDKQIHAELRELQKEGIELLKELTKGLLVAQERKKDPEKKPEHEFSLYSFGIKYQRWYSTALPLIQQLLPDRYEESSNTTGTRKGEN